MVQLVVIKRDWIYREGDDINKKKRGSFNINKSIQ